MAADDQGKAGTLRRFVKIPDCVLLARGFRQEAHVEILPPAGDGGVRPAEGDINRNAGNGKGHGGELFLFFRVDLIGVGGQEDVPEPAAGGRGDQQGPWVVDQLQLIHPGGKVPVAGFGQRQAAPFLSSRDDAPEIAVGDFGKDQIVNRVGRILHKGQVSPPVDVV